MLVDSSCTTLFLLAAEAAAAFATEDRLRLDVITVTRAIEVHVTCIGLKQIRQYEVSCNVGSGRNPLSADGA